MIEHLRRLSLPLDEKTAETLKREAVRCGSTVQAVALLVIREACEAIETAELRAGLN